MVVGRKGGGRELPQRPSGAMQGTPTNQVSVTSLEKSDIVLALMWRSTTHSMYKLLVGTTVNLVILDRVNTPSDRRWGNLEVKPLRLPEPHEHIQRQFSISINVPTVVDIFLQHCIQGCICSPGYVDIFQWNKK